MVFNRRFTSFILENVITILKNNPGMVIKIEFHTGSRGSRSSNRRLSDKRAKSTKNYILLRGMEKHRIISAIKFVLVLSLAK